VFIVVSGPPASGKSTVAPVLAQAMGLPLIAKDIIKDALMATIATPDIETSRQLGRAAVTAMYAIAAASPVGAVIESTFLRSVAIAAVGRLEGDVIEVFCRCRRQVAVQRYLNRSGTRHAGHFDADRSPEEIWNEENAQPIAGGWPVLQVDTNTPVDIEVVLARITAVNSTWSTTTAADDPGHGWPRSACLRACAIQRRA